MVDVSSPFDDIVKDFAHNKIPTDIPGFYDHPNFTAIEKQDPNYLGLYARYVQGKNYPKNYLKEAEENIALIAKVLHGELVKDGRLGACVDITMVLSRILEKQGYWNNSVKGALTIEYPPSSPLTTKYYWPVDVTEVAAGHAWLAAPPYTVVDITLKKQPYYAGEEQYLPDYVLQKHTSDIQVNTIDICSTEVIDILKKKGVPEPNMLSYVNSNLPRFLMAFKPTLVCHEGTRLKYIPVAAAAPDSVLDEITSLKLNNMYGKEIYERVVLPALEKKNKIDTY